MKRLNNTSLARVGQVFEMQPSSVTASSWHNALVRVLATDREPGYLKVKLVGFSAQASSTFDRPRIGQEATINIGVHTLTYAGGFGMWYRNHGGNDGKAAVL